MGKPRMLPGERIEAKCKPHIMSFAGRYLVAAIPALWGLGLWAIMGTDGWSQVKDGSWWQFWQFLYGNAPAAYVYTVFALGIIGAGISVVTIRWRIFFLYMATAAAAIVVTAVWFNDDYKVLFPIVLAASAPMGLIAVDLDRRSHRFVLTNLRILFKGGFFTRRERQLRYEAITDLDIQQGPFGRLFGYGTLIPVTQSGFGLGNDTSQAMVGLGAGAKAGAKGVGAGGGIGVAAGGGKEVQVGRARSYHQLTGVAPFGNIKFLLESLVQNATATPYLREQVELQRQMVAALKEARGPPRAAPFADGQPHAPTMTFRPVPGKKGKQRKARRKA